MEEAASIDGPSANRLLRRLQFADVGLRVQEGPGGSVRRSDRRHYGDADRAVLNRPEVRQWFIEMTREAFVQGGRAGDLEAGLYRRPWGFDPEQVNVETRLRYAGEDKTVPATAGRWPADRMVDAEIVVRPQHGHLSWMVGDEAADVIATTKG